MPLSTAFLFCSWCVRFPVLISMSRRMELRLQLYLGRSRLAWGTSSGIRLSKGCKQFMQPRCSYPFPQSQLWGVPLFWPNPLRLVSSYLHLPWSGVWP